MNARQRAEYDASIATMRRRTARPRLQPRSEPIRTCTEAELALATRLYDHAGATESPLDRWQHALGVARMISQGGRRR